MQTAPERPPYSPADAGLLLLRAFAGLSLALAHGVGKLPASERFIAGAAEMGFPAPALFAWAAALSESLGGLLLAVGLFTRPAALFIVATMAVAAFVRQAGDPFGERELALLFGAVALQFLLTGAGRLSVDAWLRSRVGVARVWTRDRRPAAQGSSSASSAIADSSARYRSELR